MGFRPRESDTLPCFGKPLLWETPWAEKQAYNICLVHHSFEGLDCPQGPGQNAMASLLDSQRYCEDASSITRAKLCKGMEMWLQFDHTHEHSFDKSAAGRVLFHVDYIPQS